MAVSSQGLPMPAHLSLCPCAPAAPAARRWFHGACAKVSQEDVDALGDNDTWNCVSCKAYKRQQERASARNQR